MKRTITGIIIVVIMIIGSYGLMVFFSSLKKEPPKRPASEFRMNVHTSAVAYSDHNFDIVENGRVVSKQLIDLSSEVQGKVLAGDVPLKKGEKFRKGELLASIYSSETRFNLQARKSRFLNALAGILPDLKIDFPEIYPAWNDFFNSIEIEKNIPQLPEVKNEKEKIYLASRNILSDYYTIKSEEVRLAKYNIYAPFKGSFTNVYMEIGSVANPGSKLAQIIHTGRLEIEVPVRVENAAWLKVGEKVQIYDDTKSEVYEGKLVRLADFVSPNTQSVSAFVQIDDRYSKNVYQGQYYNVAFIEKNALNTMSIPRSAVFNRNEVFTVVDGKLKKREINIERINATTIFFNGLKEGTEIVTQALVNAHDNLKVTKISEEAKASKTAK